MLAFSQLKSIWYGYQNAGQALNINIGKIKEGYLADLILVDLNNINLIPNHNLLSNLVYAGQGNWVSDVICNGKILMRNYKIKGEDENQLKKLKKELKN